MNPRHYVGLRQGQLVTVSATPNLGCVRSVVGASEPALAAVDGN